MKDHDVSKSRLLLIIAYLGFISLGLPDPVVGVAWPSVRETFGRTNSSFGLIFLSLGSGYCLSSFFGGKLMHWLGIGTLLAGSSLLVSLSMFGSGLAPAWVIFVAVAILWGLGSGAIDAGINVYVSKHFSAMHVSWLHACYSLGATIGPLLMTMALVQFHSWRIGYILIGALLLGMTMTFLLTRRMWDSPVEIEQQKPVVESGIFATLESPLVWFQILIFFLYTGLEYFVGQWAFTVLTESRGASPEVAGILAGSYYGSIGVGRVLCGAIADRVGLDRLIRSAMGLAVIGGGIFAAPVSMISSSAGLLLFGLGLAPIFPCMMARTPQRIGESLTTHAVGFQISAAMFGAAVLPAAAGLLAGRYGVSSIPWFSLLVAILMWCLHEGLLWWSKTPNPERQTISEIMPESE